MITLIHVYDFILANKKNKVFSKFTPEQIWECIDKASKENKLLYIADMEDNIQGIVIYSLNNNLQSIHIEHILCTDTSAFKHFVKTLKETCEHYTLTGKRKGKYKVYNTKKLCNKALK